ncbi:hypothetical protein [Microcystis aeruginosa]|uniref:hypothetical protein n=1 Tax=Microcystis aeruginosa TaxID=1126 RepID=UPI001F4F1865|nr:hypothetical protein [Microcystis aeruginosa]
MKRDRNGQAKILSEEEVAAILIFSIPEIGLFSLSAYFVAAVLVKPYRSGLGTLATG